jgi:hypothetical protein
MFQAQKKHHDHSEKNKFFEPLYGLIITNMHHHAAQIFNHTFAFNPPYGLYMAFLANYLGHYTDTFIYIYHTIYGLRRN